MPNFWISSSLQTFGKWNVFQKFQIVTHKSLDLFHIYNLFWRENSKVLGIFLLITSYLSKPIIPQLPTLSNLLLRVLKKIFNERHLHKGCHKDFSVSIDKYITLVMKELKISCYLNISQILHTWKLPFFLD